MNPLQDAFISYGRADSKQFAKGLKDRLAELGYTVWFDFDNIPLGVDWQAQIDDGIDKADNVLFIISPHAVNSDYCRLEVELALARGKRIIPLLHVEQISRETWQQRNPSGTDEGWAEYCAAGKHSSFNNMHPAIGKINWVYFREGLDDYEQSFQGLLELLNRQKDYVHQHTVLLNQALDWEQNQKRTRYLLIGEERQQAESWLAKRFKEEQAPCFPSDLHCEYITESIKNANNLMTQVFLCHSEQDRDVAETVRRSLMRNGITTWTHHSDIELGSDFQSAMAQGVEAADNVIFLMSPEAFQSSYCQQELDHALALNKRIIPLQTRPVEPSQIPEALQTLQYIDLADNQIDGDYQQDESDLLRLLNRDSSYYNEHKVLLTKALKWERDNRNPCLLLRGYELQHAETWLKLSTKHPKHGPTALQTDFIAESQRQPSGINLDVFMSYSRADSDFARKLNDRLQRQGKRTWFDQESIASGVDFQQEIYKGIEASDHFLFILSPKSVNSPYCADEVEYATKLNKRIVTVRYRAVEAAELHPELAKVQWIDFQGKDQDFAANFKELIRTLDADPEHLRFHTRLLMQAIAWDERGRRDGRLLRGEDLSEAEQWLLKAAGKQPSPTSLQGEYVGASRKSAANRQRSLVGVLGSLLGLALLGGGVGFWQWGEARKALGLADQRLKDAELAQEAEAEQRIIAEAALADAEAAQAAEAEQRDLAEQKTQDAEEALSDAEAAQVAEAEQRNLAEQKQQEAEESAALAQEQTTLAQEQTTLAQSETRRAETLAQEAEIEALNANIQVKSLGVETLMASELNFKAWMNALALGREIQALHVGAPTAATTKTSQISTQNPATQLRSEIRLQAISVLREIYNYPGYLHRNTLEGHKGWVWSVSFSPDGQIIASASGDGTVKLWDRSGRELQTLKGHTGGVLSVSFSPDGQIIASASGDGTVKLWDRSGRELQTLEGHMDWVRSVSFSPDGQIIASASDDGTVKLWDRSGRELQTLEGHRSWVLSVSFSPDGQTLASASGDGTVKLWDRSGRELQTLEGHRSGVRSVSFSPDGQIIASASDDGTVKLWDRSGRELQSLEGHTSWVISVSFSPDGQTIASVSDDRTVKLWDRSGRELQTLEGHKDVVLSVSFSPDGETLASASGDGTVKFWDRNGRELQTLEGHTDWVRSVSFSPDGETLASASQDYTVKLWDRSGRELQTLEGHTDWVWSVSFSPDGEMLASASGDGTVKLWDRSGRELQTLAGHTGWVLSVSFSPDGEMLASASGDGTVKLWDRSGRELQTLAGHTDGVRSVSFSPDGETLASASDDGTVKLWDRSGRELQTLEGHMDWVISVSFSPDGETIASASDDGIFKLWDRSGRELQSLEGHTSVISVNFSPDGQTLASAGGDGTVKLWDRSGRELQSLEGHTDWVRSVSFSPDGQTIASASDDGTVKLWNFNLDELLARSCDWLRDYMVNPATSKDHKALCPNQSGVSPLSQLQGAGVAYSFLNQLLNGS